MKIAKLNIDGYIGNEDIMSMFSGQETFNLSKLKKFMDSLDGDVTDLQVYINSGGGSVTEGWAIYDKLKTSKYNVTTIGEGIVGSIATVIFMAGDTRKVHENTDFFIHNPYWMAGSPEPMEAGDLKKLAGELEVEQNKILNFYSKVTGTPVSDIEPLMNDATALTSEQAVNMGFAHSIISEKIASMRYRIAACVKINQPEKTNVMEKALSNFENFLNKLNRKISKTLFKNMEFKATNSEGAEVNLFIESDTEDLTGKAAFLIDESGNQNVAPDGEYTLPDGKVVAVAAGIVDEVKAAPASEEDQPTIEQLNAQLETLKAENESLKNDLQAKLNENESMKADLEEIKNEVSTLKNTVIKSTYKSAIAGQSFKGERKKVITSENEAFANQLKNSFSFTKQN